MSVKFLWFKMLTVIFFTQSLLSGQTIESVSTGGDWSSADTWKGGAVPAAGDDVVINGTVNLPHGAECGNLTVNSGAVLQGAGLASITVHGNIVNNGSVLKDPSWNLTLNLEGNIENNGLWQPSSTMLTGQGNQEISQGTGASFEETYVFQNNDTIGRIIAKSDITFKGRTSFGVSGKWTILDMGGYTLTLDGALGYWRKGYLSSVTIENPGNIRGINNGALESAYISGNPVIKDALLVGSGTTFHDSLTIEDTLKANGLVTLTVDGDIVNNGVLIKDPSWNFDIYISGDITNNGIWNPSGTYLNGTGDQVLSQGENNPFEDTYNFRNMDTLGTIIAASDLIFKSRTSFESDNYQWTKLDMKDYKLTLDASPGYWRSGNMYKVQILNAAELNLINGGVLYQANVKGSAELTGQAFFEDNVTFEDSVTIKGTISMGSGITIYGPCVVEDTLQNGGSMGWVTVVVRDAFINNGVIRNNPAGNELWLELHDDAENNNVWECSKVYLASDNHRTVKGEGILSSISVSDEYVNFVGENILPGLSISWSVCTLHVDGSLRINNGEPPSALVNYGRVVLPKEISTAGNYSFYNFRGGFVAGSGLDSLTVESYGYQVPQSFANAVQSWWRVVPHPEGVNEFFSELVLYYDEEILGNNIEEELHVYHSPDSGLSWVRLTTDESIYRSASSNYVSISDAPASGDYLLSSSEDPVSVRPSIVVNTIGRSQFRIGAPNYYKISLLNNSASSIDDFLVSVNAGKDIIFQKAEIPLLDGEVEILPIDSLTDDPYDSTLAFYVAGLGPYEETSFDVVVTATSDFRNTSLSKTAFDPVSLTVGAVVVWGGAKLIGYGISKTMDYIGDKAAEKIDLNDQEREQYERGLGLAKGQSKIKRRKTGKAVFTMKQVGNEISDQVIGVTPVGGIAKETVESIVENTAKVAPSLRQRIFHWLYKETGLYGVEKIKDKEYKPEVSGGSSKKGVKVTSWDPNEKVGPDGYGDRGHITSAGEMHYQILFENKKEATAAAYKVVITDTLEDVFDPESFQFGRTSHEGEQYQWNMTREGNAVTWSIEGIELPPNVVPPEGEGWVTFSVNTKNDLPSGTSIKNKATIVFDVNDPIITNEWENVLDFQSPVTSMLPLDASISAKEISVKWNSDDGENGSGIESVGLYVSIDDGAYFPVGVTGDDSLVFIPEEGDHKYSFYALAKDNVGNVETERPEPVTTQINTPVSESGSFKSRFLLHQNYPNPFNPVTKIRFSVTGTEKTELVIYNVLGQKVETLVDEVMKAGIHEVGWNAGKASAGIYFYVLKSGEKVTVRKMSLIK